MTTIKKTLASAKDRRPSTQKTSYAQTDVIRLRVETIGRMKSFGGLSMSWDDIINTMLDRFKKDTEEEEETKIDSKKMKK